MQRVRIWDLPTRLFHWVLAAAVVAMVVLARIGGDAMHWHFRVGYLILALLLFRLAWGVLGGHWSRFASFWPTPRRLLRHLRGQADPAEHAGHSPLGALSVLAMLAALGLQVTSGLFADDEIAYAGPLAARVSGATVDLASRYHTSWGKFLVIGLVLLHALAIIVYLLRRHNLVGPMIWGDKRMAPGITGSRDTASRRLLALALFALAAAAVYALLQWGAAPVFG
ncbi:MAG TPA: cytochrome b/b6 domain-containing protein [Ottowia sp.]|mgnify:CR=1 FL=1|uniref:cytochrome b/b6 domain-containing protein n=1 Tax=Ottowia sp. TaxID=1898956 RepID=UPI002BFDF7B0|nr:cytochrome b/b6 domain-containing protein [Ottowia sp.]HMN22465.1 cytochrome b/b6 domain-containing protein [Ottowia sp.]